MVHPSQPEERANAPLPPALASAIVLGASGAVLVLEILAVRLLAPYVGLTLETCTTIIGVVLGGDRGGARARLALRRRERLLLRPHRGRPQRPSGRALWLDDVRHSYVDLDDPTHLDFPCARTIADIVGRLDDGPLDAVFIGGGGFTLPRWLAETRPGSRSRVLEARPGAGRPRPRPPRPADRAEPAGAHGRRARDAARRADPSAHLVVGDAFGGRAVPWHLTTREFLRDVRRVLRPDGVYAMNLIDGGDLKLVKAEAATLLGVFEHVAVISRSIGNHVLVASDARLCLPADASPGGFARGSQILRDDFAPADQLLAPRP